MRQTVNVVREYSRGHIEVEMSRASACGAGALPGNAWGIPPEPPCGGDCGVGGGVCMAPKEIIRVRARGGEGAKPGDTVVIESCSRQILGLAALVYLLPLALFFAGYAISALVGGLGFILGLGLLVPVNKVVGNKVVYNVVGLDDSLFSK